MTVTLLRGHDIKTSSRSHISHWSATVSVGGWMSNDVSERSAGAYMISALARKPRLVRYVGYWLIACCTLVVRGTNHVGQSRIRKHRDA